jgi:hypothetical protein
MLVSPFTFYRGAALIMAADLAATPNSGLRVQVCGDAHLSNFGVFASPERHADQNERDYQALAQAVDSGRVEAQNWSLRTARACSTGECRFMRRRSLEP